ncbi:MAG: hypothetical protein J7604_07625 [Sporocytophaga sp.]|uniref:hypothetical protein n=1 Tax=Sporocytophaga sp. TaxID=2231183 RepID=UPI001B0E6923|nr:hypothetical protein [Sporocytophaga sp.]MBO9700065.1 hypothetical protein [Sporocytophaga sp.]
MNIKIAINILLGLLAAVILFHLTIIFKVIPYNIAWGGRLQSDSEMYVFETISILINLFLALILLMKGGYIKSVINRKIIDIILWAFVVIFILNTIGNIFAKTILEKSFAILTLGSAILIWGILRKKKLTH